MNDMNERIKYLRNDVLKLTAEKFADGIGVTRSAIYKLESSERNPSSQTIVSIANRYNVRREWLETGQGEILNKDVQEDFSFVLSDIENSDDDFIKEFLKVYVSLDDTSKAALKEIAFRMANKKSWQE